MEYAGIRDTAMHERLAVDAFFDRPFEIKLLEKCELDLGFELA